MSLGIFWELIQDYPPVRPPIMIRTLVSNYYKSKEFRHFCKKLKLNLPRIVFRKCENGCVGVYISGSHYKPIIVIDPTEFDDILFDLKNELEITIRHEMGHAFLDSIGIHPKEHIERFVEQFARNQISHKILMAIHFPQERS